MSLKHILIGSLAAAALSVPVFADQTNFPSQVRDIIVTSNIPTVNISVRNMSNSTDPADRNLRMVSNDPVIGVTGQVWCNGSNSAETGARRAQIMYGNPGLNYAGYGNTVIDIGVWSQSDTQEFNGTNALENFDLSAPMNLPASWDSNALVTFGFNPVQHVEERLENFIENNAGSEADFLRIDDVFETQVALNVVGWCRYDHPAYDTTYAGIRSIPVTVAIFYHGDPDIQDVITSVGGANTITAPVPNRARGTATARGANSQPPATSEPPARTRPQRARTPENDGGRRPQAGYTSGVRVATGDVNNDGRKMADVSKQDRPAPARQGRRDAGNGQAEPQAGLLLPAVQQVRSEQEDSSADQGTINYTGLENRAAGIEPDEIDNSVAQEADAEPQDVYLHTPQGSPRGDGN